MGMLVIADADRKEYYWVSYIKNRIRNRKNIIILVSGPTGAGKSLTGLSLCNILDPNFNSSKQIIFGLRGMMDNILAEGENKFKSGTPFLWDEFQLEAGARNWQSVTNKLLNSLLSTFRHRNFILIITSPYVDFLDSQTRKLIHAEFEVISIDYNAQKTRVKPQLIQYNSRIKKFYYKYLRVRLRKGMTSPVKIWNIPRPPKQLEEQYEVLKANFTKDLNRSIVMQLDELEPRENKQILTDLQAQALDLMDEYNLDIKKVADIMKISVRTIQFHLLQAKKKGYVLEKHGGN